MTEKRKNQIAGAAGGLVNGLFGGGGGMALLPLLTKSTAVYLWQVRPGLELVLPYLLGGLIGGVLGGLTFEKVPVRWLKVIFGLFLLYGGVRYLLW